MKSQKSICAGAVFVLAFMFAACERTPPFQDLVGQRLLGFQIEVDGDVHYTGIRSVNDNIPAAEVWDVIGTVEFESTNDGNAEDHLDGMTWRTISGTIVVRFHHNSFGDERTFDRLSLRTENGGKSWSLGQHEVERNWTANRDQ